MNKKPKGKYQNLTKNINQKYEQLMVYPSLFNMINFQLRLAEVGESHLVNKNLLKIYKRSFPFSGIWRSIFLIYCRLRFQFNNKQVLFIRSNSFSKFSYREFVKCLENKYLIIGTGLKIFGLKGHLKYIFSEAFIFDVLERTSFVNKVFKNFNCISFNQLIENLKDKNFLKELNIAIEKDKKIIIEFIKFADIKAVLLNTDQSTFNNIFISAANACNIRTGIIAHGNFRNPYAVGVLPLYAERLFVWTEKAKNDLNYWSNSNKVKVIEGLRKNIIIRKESESNNKILLAASPFKMYKNNNSLKNYFNILKIIANISPKFQYVYVPHPQDDLSLKKEIIKTGFNWARNSIYKEAINAKLVIGAHTSFLYECKVSQIPAIQLIDLCFNVDIQKTIAIPQVGIENFKNLADLNNIVKKLRIKENKINLSEIYEYLTK